jgi:hypothetical protein
MVTSRRLGVDVWAVGGVRRVAVLAKPPAARRRGSTGLGGGTLGSLVRLFPSHSGEAMHLWRVSQLGVLARDDAPSSPGAVEVGVSAGVGLVSSPAAPLAESPKDSWAGRHTWASILGTFLCPVDLFDDEALPEVVGLVADPPS